MMKASRPSTIITLSRDRAITGIGCVGASIVTTNKRTIRACYFVTDSGTAPATSYPKTIINRTGPQFEGDVITQLTKGRSSVWIKRKKTTFGS